MWAWLKNWIKEHRHTEYVMDLQDPAVRAWQAENMRLSREGYTLITEGNHDGPDRDYKMKDGVKTPRDPAPVKKETRWVW